MSEAKFHYAWESGPVPLSGECQCEELANEAAIFKQAAENNVPPYKVEGLYFEAHAGYLTEGWDHVRYRTKIWKAEHKEHVFQIECGMHKVKAYNMSFKILCPLRPEDWIEEEE